MLARAARRKLQHETYKSLQPAFEQIRLPWLCPALLADEKHSRTTSTIACEHRVVAPIAGQRRVPRVASSLSERKNLRGLAFAATAGEYESQDRYVPFENHYAPHEFSPASFQSWSKGGGMTSLPHFDPSSPLIIKDSLTVGSRRIRTSNSMGGDISDIHETLHACLQVGRLDRAEAMMRRLNITYKPDAPELIEAHNEYIGSLLERIVTTKDQALLKYIQRWFEVDLRAKGVIPTAITYALMIRATFQESKSAKVDRTIRRYISLAEQAGVLDEAMHITLSMLNSQELGRLTRIAPMTFQPAPEIVLVHADTKTTTTDGPDLLSNFNAPEVRPAEQKGLGLDALMKSLSVFSGAPSMGNEGETEVGSEEATRSFQYMRQKRIEEDTLTSAVDRWRVETEQMKKMGIDNSLGLQNIGVLMWAWHEALVPLIREEIQKANEADGLTDKGAIDRERQAYGPFLQYLSPEKLSAVTILTCLTAVSTSGVDRALRLSSLLSRVGAAVQDETLADSIKNNRNAGIWRNLSLPDRQQKLASLVKRIHTHSSLAKFVREAEILPHSAKDHSWSTTIKTKVGAVLVAHLIQAAKIHVRRVHPTTGQESKEAQPVFWSTHQYDRGKRVGVVRMNAAMAQKLSKEPVHSALSKHLPMIVEPAPWKGYKQGGYLLQAVSVVRMGLGDQQMKSYVQAAAESGDMDQIFAGLDVLGRTPWKINRGVFNVMIEAWNTGTAIANMPPENPKLDYPPEPEPSDDPRVRQAWRYRIKVIDNERSGFHSTRCFQNFQLEVARAYLNETFYFPHNIDFRGRAYPIPPYLNHMGADNCRGLLLFGKGKELGSAGLTWLKVHLANVFGFDKASFQERQDFATNHLTDIYDSASNPLGGGKWWLKAEDPWQCLAACMELKQALDSPDPTRFVSHLPIHQDGTCNGLQHYAALGGDAIGAKQVNLEPGERPSDIYTAVAEMIKSEIVEDAAQGVEVAQLLEGKVTRKVVKQTVMTNVYGVTFAGAKKQVRRQLEDLLPDFPDRSTVNLDIASYYIAKRIFKALSAMFNGAHDIQYWLGDCAARICEALTPEQIQWIEDDAAGKAESTPFASVPIDRKNIKEEQSRFKSSVIWTTPLKMPVVQPYRTPTSRLVATHLQSIALTEPSISDPVSKRKQLQAFPPNFIHSLDATHMLLSALKCDEVGLSFAAVHDSFWTHAADVDIMNRIIRDAFIRMHTEDIIGRLAAEFSARYKDCMYLASVRANSVLGKKILALRKHTRQTGKKAKQASKFRELLDERRRVRLLASADPAEQAEGEAMMTPSRLFLETADENDLAPLEQLEETGIGKIPSIQQALQSPDLTQEHDEISDVNEDPGDTLQPVGSDGQEEPTTFSADFEHGKIEAVAETDPENELIVQDSMQKTKSKIGKTSKKDRKVLIWLPLTFPPVPKKGDFDVTRLKNSQYFFS